MKSEKDRKRDLEFGYVRPLTPRPYPKTFRRLRPPRRRTILDRANALVNEELRRGVERLERHGRPGKNFPYRPPRLRDLLPPQPDPAAATTVTTDGQYKTRLYRGKKRGQSKKKRGRPPLTEAQKYKRALRRAVSLYQRVVREKMAPADAWYAVNPESGMSRANATRETQRLIAWLRREHPPTLEERLHLAGLDDLDVICRAIKTFLEANLPATKRLPERANWYIRKKGLELLMRGLGLATWRGFRSGPYAVGGERELEPVERNDVPAGDEDSVADVKRRIKAQSIFFRYQVEGVPLADCWLELTPDSKANRMTAKKEAMKLVDYFEKRYGSSLSERLIANGLDEQVVISTIKALKAAGRADDRDWKITAWGLDMQMVILGFRPPSGRCVPRQAVDVTGMLHGDPDEAALSPEAARRYIATELYKLHFRSGMPLADARSKPHPGDRNRLSAELASRVAAGELTWFRQAYPMPMVALMEVHGPGARQPETDVGAAGSDEDAESQHIQWGSAGSRTSGEGIRIEDCPHPTIDEACRTHI
ncbi:MAG: hypothetical protein OXG35_05805, partial [Acidobacteria bacterium]|nr:hypothetical protein [Acidobacteriota bacterium]